MKPETISSSVIEENGISSLAMGALIDTRSSFSSTHSPLMNRMETGITARAAMRMTMYHRNDSGVHRSSTVSTAMMAIDATRPRTIFVVSFMRLSPCRSGSCEGHAPHRMVDGFAYLRIQRADAMVPYVRRS